jgi:hypothetical protein
VGAVLNVSRVCVCVSATLHVMPRHSTLCAKQGAQKPVSPKTCIAIAANVLHWQWCCVCVCAFLPTAVVIFVVNF